MESLFFTLFSGAVVLNFHITPSTADDKDRQFVSLDLAITLPHKVQRYTHKNLAPLSFLHHFVCTVSQRQTRDSFQPITWVVRRPLERVSPPVPCSHHSLICNLILAVSIPPKKNKKKCAEWRLGMKFISPTLCLSCKQYCRRPWVQIHRV